MDTTEIIASRQTCEGARFGSFRELERLKTLVVPECIIFRGKRDEVLPASLETLYLLGVPHHSNESSSGLEGLARRVVSVPLHAYTIELSRLREGTDWCVDYDAVKELGLRTSTTRYP